MRSSVLWMRVCVWSAGVLERLIMAVSPPAKTEAPADWPAADDFSAQAIAKREAVSAAHGVDDVADAVAAHVVAVVAEAAAAAEDDIEVAEGEPAEPPARRESRWRRRRRRRRGGGELWRCCRSSGDSYHRVRLRLHLQYRILSTIMGVILSALTAL